MANKKVLVSTALLAGAAMMLVGCANGNIEELPKADIDTVLLDYRYTADSAPLSFTIDCVEQDKSQYPGDVTEACEWLTEYYIELADYEWPVACVEGEGGTELMDITVKQVGVSARTHNLERTSGCKLQEWGAWVTLIKPISDTYLTDITDYPGHPGYTGE